MTEREKPRMPLWLANVLAGLIVLLGLAGVVLLAVLGVGLVR